MQLSEVAANFEEWPERWMGLEEDLEYGRGLLEAMRPFAESLIVSGMSISTIRRHLASLWLLGGEIIHEVSLFEEYEVPPLEKLQQSVDVEGGPLCRHVSSPSEAASFDRTCRKLAKFLDA
jgi:hypothetical protein